MYREARPAASQPRQGQGPSHPSLYNPSGRQVGGRVGHPATAAEDRPRLQVQRARPVPRRWRGGTGDFPSRGCPQIQIDPARPSDQGAAPAVTTGTKDPLPSHAQSEQGKLQGLEPAVIQEHRSERADLGRALEQVSPGSRHSAGGPPVRRVQGNG